MYTVVYRKTMLCPVNITILHKVLYKVVLKSLKSLFSSEKLRHKSYVDKDIIEKVR